MTEPVLDLLRGFQEAGFPDIPSVFDAAYLDASLASVDLRLRAKALGDFAAWAPPGAKLFYNIDNRTFLSSPDALDETIAAAEGLGLAPSRIALEISERHELEGSDLFDRIFYKVDLRPLRNRALMLAPRILLVDEPSVGLAPQLVSRTIDAIKQLKEHYHLTVLMAEQIAGLRQWAGGRTVRAD